jgi:hypothetical protein
MEEAQTKMATAIKHRQKPRREVARPKKTDAERPIWETVAELGSQISESEWEQVPDDSSIHYKHHLYGAPAKPV